ncbi:uncharacterized protein LOC125540558 [Triticum urartu]|uniref:Uncharacterized protein n=1 Tax=Triticum urartu TaxID=4572 RepID=A0A8R7P8S1_TRIUA|nr:uncharacterized protein LOC119358543 [Triticum dicoccoides]XP_048560130.1 uncharacterized protein LOC125540558 [Triticum urartu]
MEAEMYVHHAEPLRANTATCIPRLRGGGVRRRPPRGAAPASTASASVMDRVRDVLLRLAMLSAASTSPKAGARLQQHTMAAAPTRAASVRMSPSYSESYPSDAVDDCIEFLKRSAAGNGAVVSAPAGAAAAESVSSAPPPSPLHA